MSGASVVLKPLRKVMPANENGSPAPRVPQWSPRDAYLLETYFGSGQTWFERSTFGGMLERAEMFGVAHQPTPTEPVYDSRTGETVIGRESCLSARPTAELRPQAGYVPDDSQLQLFAVVSARMMRVERMDPLAYAVISLYYGDAAHRWSGGPHGRLGALFVLTSKGMDMVRDAAKVPGALDVTPAQRLESISAVQQAQPTAARKEAFAICMAQAEALEFRARSVWYQVKE